MTTLKSFDQNLPLLEDAYQNFHTNWCKGIPGGDALKGIITVSAKTKEIVSLGLYENKAFSRKIIFPQFAEGVDTQSMLRKIGGKGYELSFSVSSLVSKYKSFAREYWSPEDFELLEHAVMLSDPLLMMECALTVARHVIKKTPHHTIGLVSGSVLSADSTRSTEYHQNAFHNAVLKVAENPDQDVFNTVPFRPLFSRVVSLLRSTHAPLIKGKTPSEFLMETFYLPIFRGPGKDWRLYLIEGWKSSPGAVLKYKQLHARKCEIFELDREFHAPVLVG